MKDGVKRWSELEVVGQAGWGYDAVERRKWGKGSMRLHAELGGVSTI